MSLVLPYHEECGPECCMGVLSCGGEAPDECGACFLLGADAGVGVEEGQAAAVRARQAAHAFNGGRA